VIFDFFRALTAVEIRQKCRPGSTSEPSTFNPTTVVSYQLPLASMRLVVYDLLGGGGLVDRGGRDGESSLDATQLSRCVHALTHCGMFMLSRRMIVLRWIRRLSVRGGLTASHSGGPWLVCWRV
jgi:hypothetical protein